MSTTEGEEPEEKKYCCGNSAQNEAGYVSKCDIALVVNGLVAYTLVTVLLFVSEEHLQGYVDRNPFMKDLNYLIQAHKLYQIVFSIASFTWLIFELGLAIILLRGSTLRSKRLLKKWFNLTCFVCVIGVSTSSFAVYSMQEKTYIGVGALIYYLYKWYGLWICLELLKEIKLGINAYTLPCEF